MGKVVVLEPGEVLFKVGDPMLDMYYVADGLLRAEHMAQGGKPERLGYSERGMTIGLTFMRTVRDVRRWRGPAAGMRRARLGGVVAKMIAEPYRSGKTASWVRVNASRGSS